MQFRLNLCAERNGPTDGKDSKFSAGGGCMVTPGNRNFQGSYLVAQVTTITHDPVTRKN